MRLSVIPLLAWCSACWQPPDYQLPGKPTDAEFIAQRPYGLAAPRAPDGGVLDAGVPDGGASGWPLIVVLHGYGTTGLQAQAYLGLNSPEVVSRYYVATPNGTTASTRVPAWHPELPAAFPWDSAYLSAVIADAVSKAPIDPARVFVVGTSQGAHMAHRVACDHAELVSAMVAISGQLTDGAPSRPVPVLTVHGTKDSAIPFGGSLGAEATVALWAQADGCTGVLAETGQTLQLTLGNETTVVEAVSGCPAGVDVELWKMVGVDHGPDWNDTFPGAITGFLDQHAGR